MILLDTCALIFDALAPERLSDKALQAIENGDKRGALACSDISLWEIGMLTSRGRLEVGVDLLSFLRLILSARMIQPLMIVPEIAQISTNDGLFAHYDPADRIIAATALHHDLPLVTCDTALQSIGGLKTIW